MSVGIQLVGKLSLLGPFNLNQTPGPVLGGSWTLVFTDMTVGTGVSFGTNILTKASKQANYVSVVPLLAACLLAAPSSSTYIHTYIHIHINTHLLPPRASKQPSSICTTSSPMPCPPVATLQWQSRRHTCLERSLARLRPLLSPPTRSPLLLLMPRFPNLPGPRQKPCPRNRTVLVSYIHFLHAYFLRINFCVCVLFAYFIASFLSASCIRPPVFCLVRFKKPFY
jgi:hypothetical protein